MHSHLSPNLDDEPGDDDEKGQNGEDEKADHVTIIKQTGRLVQLGQHNTEGGKQAGKKTAMRLEVMMEAAT